MLNGDCWAIEKVSRVFRFSSIKLFKLVDSRILTFAMVGGCGFVVDASLLTLLSMQFCFDVLPSRVVSFTCATLVTWLLNRTITFSCRASQVTQARRKEYFFYLMVQMVGATLNFAVFLVLVEWKPVLSQVPVVPLAGGALVALVFNFVMSCQFVFKNQAVADDLSSAG
ncbi:MAG: GtrA family protein [Desulfobulbaceae bacterium]|nr:GtrA family protein [Desulfobulbaceae bacterium]